MAAGRHVDEGCGIWAAGNLDVVGGDAVAVIGLPLGPVIAICTPADVTPFGTGAGVVVTLTMTIMMGS